LSARLSEFIEQRREIIANRWVDILLSESASEALSRDEVRNSMIEFLQDVADGLRDEAARPWKTKRPGEATAQAKHHGQQRFRLGYNLDALIREYATLRDVLYEVMTAEDFHPQSSESHALSRFLIEGIANAATQYAQERDTEVRNQAAQHMGFLAHELRNPLQSASLRLEIVERRGDVPTPADLARVRRAIKEVCERLDNEIANVRLKGSPTIERQPMVLNPILEALAEDAGPDGNGKDVQVLVEAEPAVTLDGDRRLLHSVLSNLVRNAVKFSQPGSAVRVRAKTSDERVVVEVEDACGGLPEGSVEKMFDPFVQLGKDRSGFGLGLAIAKQAAELHGGGLRVHDLPGRGCVFVLDLPSRDTDLPTR
jgi:hypothetical protein